MLARARVIEAACQLENDETGDLSAFELEHWFGFCRTGNLDLTPRTKNAAGEATRNAAACHDEDTVQKVSGGFVKLLLKRISQGALYHSQIRLTCVRIPSLTIVGFVANTAIITRDAHFGRLRVYDADFRGIELRDTSFNMVRMEDVKLAWLTFRHYDDFRAKQQERLSQDEGEPFYTMGGYER